MPIQGRKQPFTLQEKVDKAIELTYEIKDTQDAEFLRGFLVQLVEKAYIKLEGANIEDIKRTQQ